ncbi:cytochrome P450 [Cunninghamella echinulata]|nr:cytochrome P450 [Cunninghamella echinulata]
MGHQKWIVISDPFIAHDIFTTNGAYTSGRPSGTFGHDIYGRNGRGIVFATNNKKWRDTRAAAFTMLSNKSVDELLDTIVYEIDILINKLFDTKEQNLNPKEHFQLISYNVIMTTCFATRAPTIEDPTFQQITEMLHIQNKNAAAMQYVGSFIPWLGWLDVITGKKRKLRYLNHKYRDTIFPALVDESRAHGKECMVNRLYSLQDEYHLDDDDILVTMSDLIVAGSDTVYVTLLWACAIFANHPEVQKKICNEVDQFLKTYQRYPTFGEYTQFPYLMSSLKECMRYRSTVPFTAPHMVTGDFDYQGYQFTKGDILLADIYTLNKTSSVYQDHDTFIPDRYIDDQKTMTASANGSVQLRDHYNFGYGRRICPGIYLAETEMFNIWVRIFARFTIESAIDEQGNNIKPNIEDIVDSGIVLEPENYEVRFVERDNYISI